MFSSHFKFVLHLLPPCRCKWLFTMWISWNSTFLEQPYSTLQLKNPVKNSDCSALQGKNGVAFFGGDGYSAHCIMGGNSNLKSEICGRSWYLWGLNVLFEAFHQLRLCWRFQMAFLSKKWSYWRLKIFSNSKIFCHLTTLSYHPPSTKPWLLKGKCTHRIINSGLKF